MTTTAHPTGLQINLEGKTALVTGATGQLGRVMVRTLAHAGADVAIHYHRNEALAAELCAELRDQGRAAGIFQADVTAEASVFRLRDAVKEQLGDPHIVVNNAVIQYAWTPVLEQSTEDFEGQFRSTVMHNVFMAKAFAPAMVSRRGGRIIAINTECAMLCAQTSSAYVSGKRGQDGLLRVLARELGPHGITVNQVAPGWTISDKDRAEGTESRPAYEAEVPLRRRGQDQEIANVVAFLASDLASYISGVYLPVCGGHVMPAI
jgi:3-oxoacyl-[acyl-carrier protein] reductase